MKALDVYVRAECGAVPEHAPSVRTIERPRIPPRRPQRPWLTEDRPSISKSVEWATFETGVGLEAASPCRCERAGVEARRVLATDGLLSFARLTHGTGPVSRAVCHTWEGLHRTRPMLVGGCRPIALANYVHGTQWRVRQRDIVCRWGVCSDVLIAERRG